MKILDPTEHTPFNIDDEGTRKFEAFLDRNCPMWREHEEFKSHNAGTIKREWAVGIDDIERVALYRGQYVEIYDQYFEKQDDGEVGIHYPKNVLCDIDGDLTPVAVWGERKPDREWECSLLPRYRTSIEETYSAAVAQGFVDPVIAGFDVVHEFARNMAVEHFGADAVQSVMQAARPGEPSLLTAVLSLEQAERVLSHMVGFKHIDDIQSQGMVAVVFIRNGKSEWIAMPKPGEDPSELTAD